MKYVTFGVVLSSLLISSSFAAISSRPIAASGLASTATPITSTEAILGIHLKEEIQNVEVDAYEFLAGQPMTLALEEVVEKVRTLEASSEDLSDEELVSLMLKSL